MHGNTLPTQTGQAAPTPSVDDAPPFDWRALLHIHPAAELFPLMKDMDPAGFRDLVEDIRAHGLAEPIVGWASNEGVSVLEGRNRLDALAQLGLLYKTSDHHVGIKKWTGSEWSDRLGARIDGYDGAFRIIYEREGLDPYELVISLNVHRRHLTSELKHQVIAEVLKAKTELSNRQIGALTKTDKKKVQAVRAKMEATGEITPVEKTVGKDGKARPAKKAKRRWEGSVAAAHEATAEAILQMREAQPAADVDDAAFEVENAEQIKKNILDTVDQSCAVVGAYKKILKVSSPFEQGAKDEISTAIGRLITKWKTLQAALARKEDDVAASADQMKVKLAKLEQPGAAE